jgi:UDP-N-acetylglucosamine 1-carboxyvinyltransferase
MQLKTPEQVKKLRESLGLSQREFARLIDRDDGLVSKWETGKSPVPDYLETRLAKVLQKPGLDKIRVTGGRALNGSIPISGAKNSALKLMCASLLTAEPVYFDNMPNALRDISSQSDLLEHLGCVIAVEGNTMTINAGGVSHCDAPYELVRKMRTSILVLGPLLARFSEARVSLPGGCAIGTRPVDLHIEGLKKLGAKIELSDGYINASAPDGLIGARIEFPKVSVGATENLLMAATLAKGETVLVNAAREPEIVDLGNCLIAMGAKISGLGTSEIHIQGIEKLHGARHSVIADRIETGTWMIAVTLTGGALRLQNTRLEYLAALAEPLEKAGAKISQDGNDILVSRSGAALTGTDIMTEPYPGFPTDLQAQFMTMLTLCMGAGMVTETIFENRFMHVPELARMGADITVHHGSALVRGVAKLKGAEVMATDLRASVALVLAGLVAEGTTTVNRIYHLDRGYENLVQKLRAVGADIERVA